MMPYITDAPQNNKTRIPVDYDLIKGEDPKELPPCYRVFGDPVELLSKS